MISQYILTEEQRSMQDLLGVSNDTLICPHLKAKIGTCMPRSIRDSWYEVEKGDGNVLLAYSREDTFRYDSGDVVITWDFYTIRTERGWHRLTVAYEKGTASPFTP